MKSFLWNRLVWGQYIGQEIDHLSFLSFGMGKFFNIQIRVVGKTVSTIIENNDKKIEIEKKTCQQTFSCLDLDLSNLNKFSNSELKMLAFILNTLCWTKLEIIRL